MNYYPFDSRNSLYRSNIGALAEGETLRLKVLLHRDADVREVFLLIKNDCEPSFHEIMLHPAEMLEDYRFYECEITPKEGLYWYKFRYTSEYGEFFITKTDTSLGIVSSEGASWQQTVFSGSFKTPDWLKGGIIYQIFPDRFYSSGEVKKNVPNDRYINKNWYKQPEYKYDKDEMCRLGNDYYGGDLKGIAEKLPYIASLGVSCIYLNPIFEAHSNHRYNTADYLKIDPLLGTEEDLEALVKKAEEYGINIILDGVFSHTGDDSVYFNKYCRYDGNGAYNSPQSPYFDWYKFTDYPEKYESWWGITTLPETDENNPSFTEFITGEKGVLKYWLKKGVKGWRLDVADELPDEFLDKIRLAIKSESSDNYLLGEVWEDASNKISYGSRRRFLRGSQLDSVMNYPFGNAIIGFLMGEDASILTNTVLSIAENYPPGALNLLMNHIGTHDTARILTRLGSSRDCFGDRSLQAVDRLSEEEYRLAVSRLKAAAVIQYTLPGVPSLYYGDEAGLEGYGDPFCRAGYPWGRENTELLEYYKSLGNFRRNCNVLKKGNFAPVFASGNCLAYKRFDENGEITVAVNSGAEPFVLPSKTDGLNIKFGTCSVLEDGILLAPYGFVVF